MKNSIIQANCIIPIGDNRFIHHFHILKRSVAETNDISDTESEIYHQINVIDCECSINSIDYDATDLKIILDRFDNRGTIAIRFRNVFAYRVTLEHFRMTEVMVGLTSGLLYEVENSSYLGEIMATGMSALYGSSLNVKHYAIKTTEHIVDILTSEAYIIDRS